MKRVFFILGLPRSRTAWLAAFLGGGDVHCWHELPWKSAGVKAVLKIIEGTGAEIVGDADSGAVMEWDDIRKALPEAVVVIVQRGIKDAVASFAEVTRIETEAVHATFAECQAALTKIAETEKHLSIQFGDLSSEETIRGLWDYVTDGLEFPIDRWKLFSNFHVQQEPEIIRRAARTSNLLWRETSPWWREQELSLTELELLDALFTAHHLSASRGNISRDTVIMAGCGSGDYIKSIAAAMMTLGDTHAPLIQSYEVLERGLKEPCASIVESYISRGDRVPGWGNSFVKGEEDSLWKEARALLSRDNIGIITFIDAVTSCLHGHGKGIFPNPSIYTAACAVTLGIPKPSCPWLFVSARLNAWSRLFQSTQQQF